MFSSFTRPSRLVIVFHNYNHAHNIAYIPFIPFTRPANYPLKWLPTFFWLVSQDVVLSFSSGFYLRPMAGFLEAWLTHALMIHISDTGSPSLPQSVLSLYTSLHVFLDYQFCDGCNHLQPRCISPSHYPQVSFNYKQNISTNHDVVNYFFSYFLSFAGLYYDISPPDVECIICNCVTSSWIIIMLDISGFWECQRLGYIRFPALSWQSHPHVVNECFDAMSDMRRSRRGKSNNRKKETKEQFWRIRVPLAAAWKGTN